MVIKLSNQCHNLCCCCCPCWEFLMGRCEVLNIVLPAKLQLRDLITLNLTWGVAKGLVQWLRFVGDKHSSNTCNLSGMELRGRYWWKGACWNTVTSLTLYWTLAKFYPLLWYGKKSTTCLPHASYIFVFLLSCPVCPLSSPISFCTY